MTHWLTWPTLLILVCAAVPSCRTEMDSSYAELLRAVEPDSSCNLATSNAFSSLGYYDPRVNGGEGYKLTYVIKNNLAKAADDTVALGELTNVHGVVNDVYVDGFEGCWYIASDANFIAAQDPNGIIDCSHFPSQSGFVVAPQTTLEGGDTQTVSINVLALEDMRTLFGADFTPGLIPNEGIVATLHDTDDGGSFAQSYSLDTESPADPTTRSAYWGKAYPTQRDVPVNVQLRAKMHTQNGTTFHTNWMPFPIKVRPGGLANGCGMLQYKVCARGACANGDPCSAAGTCSDSSQCSNITLLSGSAAAFDFVQACLPAQNYFETTKACVDVGCDASK